MGCTKRTIRVELYGSYNASGRDGGPARRGSGCEAAGPQSSPPGPCRLESTCPGASDRFLNLLHGKSLPSIQHYVNVAPAQVRERSRALLVAWDHHLPRGPMSLIESR